ncbi:MAG: DUF2339 domain-containing protein [Myxococcaceae bacterium]
MKPEAHRAVNPMKLDSGVLMSAGAVLLALAGFFLWRDLAVRPELLVGAGAVLAAGVSLAGVRRRWPLVGPIVLLATGLLGGGWYAATREPVLLGALAVTLAASLATALGTQHAMPSEKERYQRVLAWYGLAVAALVTSFAFYFHFLTLGAAQDELGRRAILTLGWLVAGVSFVLWGRKRGENAIRDAGFLFLAAAVGKAVLYDTTHLEGMLRVGLLAVAGAVLLGSGAIATRIRPAGAGQVTR